ncbi:uncharacterized protein [Triticum aestivum]|uniref:uncharacterized protein n=1 Tax=Triticum aestivum TaxID=4565 RepID=UPI001D02E6E5|nr:uncharacterized protein LOC123086116 [Triticum aestivum]XP_044363765.1 uncharacterized protein LOC123086116 [Triticum aestivum]
MASSLQNDIQKFKEDPKTNKRASCPGVCVLGLVFSVCVRARMSSLCGSLCFVLTFHLPNTVVPLHLNSERSAILAWMLECSTKGVKGSWKLPKLAYEMKWASELTEVAEREESNLVKATTVEEEAYIASRVAEARRLEAARAAGAPEGTEDDDDDEEEDDADEEELAEERQEELGVGKVARAEITRKPEGEEPQVFELPCHLRSRGIQESAGTPPP